SLLGAEYDLAARLQGFECLDAPQKLLERGRLSRRRTTRGLRVRHPVEVLQIEPEHGADGPRRLGQIDETVQGQGREELTRELLVVGRRQTDRGAVGAAQAELRQHRRVAPGRGAGGHEERRELEALGELELRRDAGDRETARRVAVAESYDV